MIQSPVVGLYAENGFGLSFKAVNDVFSLSPQEIIFLTYNLTRFVQLLVIHIQQLKIIQPLIYRKVLSNGSFNDLLALIWCL